MSDSVSIRKDNKDIFLPSIIIIFITAFVFAGFYLIKSVDNDLVCRITDVAGEETDPTMGRLIVCLTYFVSSLVLVTVADRRWKKDTDKLLLNWTLAVLGGTLLWTSVGECSWHFGLDVVSDEGTKMFASFPRIEHPRRSFLYIRLSDVCCLLQESKLSYSIVHAGISR